MKKKKIYYRLLFLNLLLLMIGVIIPNQIIYRYSIDFIYRNIHEYNVIKVDQISNTIDELVKNIIEVPIDNITDLKTNETLTKPLHEDISKSFIDIKQVMNEVSGIVHKNEFINELSLYYYEGDVFFYDDTVNFIGNRSQKKINIPKWFEKIYQEDINTLWYKHMDEQSKEYITYARTVPFFSDIKDRKGIMGVTIDLNMIYEIIDSYYVENHMGQQFVIIDEKNNPIVGYPKKMVKADLDQVMGQMNAQQLNDKNLYEISINNESYLASIIPSEYNDWKFIALSSLDSYYKTADQYKDIYFFIFIMIILINIIIIYWSTRKAYKPINNIVNVFKGISKDDGSTEDEYTFIINTANSVESRITELNKKLKAYQPLIQYNLIWEILNKAKNDINQEIFKASGISLDLNKSCCLIVKVHRNDVLEDKIILNYKLINALNEQMINRYKCYSVLNEDNDLVLLLNYESKFQHVIDLIRTIIEGCTTQGYTLCIGQEVQEIATISESYSQAKYVKRWTFIKCNEKVIYYKDIAKEELKADGSAYKVLYHIEEALRECKIEDVQYKIKVLIEGLKYGHYRIEYCENTLLELCSRLRNLFMERGFNSDLILEVDIREVPNIIENINEFEAKINGIVLTIIHHIRDKKDKLPVELEYKIDRYIEENIYNDISLETMADELDISYELLSKQFKDLKGITFSKYMMELKMKNAKELLLTTELSVKEISNKLGYNATPYFISRFKKIYGQTPLQYKKTNGKV
ncbi:AraC family transcriptional regulator [Vallitalea okinawensis]|uniref:AraC family transcriptional regulator n=1 Tax=Vallitalea okinawensis TaxID=2078660 RepID=UPI000CFCD56F|nr:AraC family transcriptional regulator [Vallitalea okinawensis]